MEPNIRHQHISIVSNEILDNLGRAVDNVDVSPVYPRVFGFQSGRKQVISGPCHELSSRTLRRPSMPVLDGLAGLFGIHVLLNDHCAFEADTVRSPLDAVKLGSKYG
jgi:hypothetical protein